MIELKPKQKGSLRNMKNLFDFATKELSQDAFLRWFIANDYEDSGKKLLAKFINVDYKKIEIGQTWAQSENIDITINFKVDDVDHILIIEDKVNTSQHDEQLIRYMKTVKKWNGWKSKHVDRPSHFIFYKPRILSEKDKEVIQKDNVINNCDWQWQVFDLNLIDDFFKDYKDSDNLIIRQYAEYIESLFEKSNNKELPIDNDILAWKSLFEKVVKPELQKDNNSYDVFVRETFYGYSYIKIIPKGSNENETPYLEIRSRDCLQNHIIGRILTYDVVGQEDKIEKIKARIGSESKFKKERYSKQIASTTKKKQRLEYHGKDDFIKVVKEIAEDYLTLMD